MIKMESDTHKQLKQKGIEILKIMGFKDNEILVEHYIEELKLTPDVIGINDNYSVAIECGNMSVSDKKEILETHFDHVIELPYLEKRIARFTLQMRKEDRKKKRSPTLVEIALNNLELLARAENTKEGRRLVKMIKYHKYQEGLEGIRPKKEKVRRTPIIPKPDPRVKLVLDVMTYLQWKHKEKYSRGIPIEVIDLKCKDADCEMLDVQGKLNKLNQAGDIYRTGPDKYKTVDCPPSTYEELLRYVRNKGVEPNEEQKEHLRGIASREWDEYENKFRDIVNLFEGRR